MSSKNMAVLHRHKYVAMLALLIAALAIQSFRPRPGVAGLLSDVFRTMLGIAVFLVVFERPRERAAAAVLLAAVVGIGWSRHFTGGIPGYAPSLVYDALTALYLWVAIWVILRELFRKPPVGAENVLGAICGYLIAGEAWAAVNTFTYLLVPTAYSISSDVSALVADWHGRWALFSYYGLAQMLTIGYADVTPVRAPATTLSLFGALFGMFYTAIVVSQFVGLAQAGKAEGNGS